MGRQPSNLPSLEVSAFSQHIEKRQNVDGGWSQAADMPSDAWATGQALYVLAQTGHDVAKPMIVRAQDFLIKVSTRGWFVAHEVATDEARR